MLLLEVLKSTMPQALALQITSTRKKKIVWNRVPVLALSNALNVTIAYCLSIHTPDLRTNRHCKRHWVGGTDANMGSRMETSAA